jgi:hypothetical protein
MRTNPNDPQVHKEIDALWSAGEQLIEDMRQLKGAAASPEAAAAWAEANRLHQSGQSIEAVRVLVNVHSLLASSLEPERSADSDGQPSITAFDTARVEVDSVPQRTEANVIPPNGNDQATPGDAADPIRGATQAASDESAIRLSLNRYAQGFRSRDASAVAGVFPSVDREGLERAFRDLRAQDLQNPGLAHKYQRYARNGQRTRAADSDT